MVLPFFVFIFFEELHRSTLFCKVNIILKSKRLLMDLDSKLAQKYRQGT